MMQVVRCNVCEEKQKALEILDITFSLDAVPDETWEICLPKKEEEK